MKEFSNKVKTVNALKALFENVKEDENSIEGDKTLEYTDALLAETNQKLLDYNKTIKENEERFAKIIKSLGENPASYKLEEFIKVLTGLNTSLKNCKTVYLKMEERKRKEALKQAKKK